MFEIALLLTLTLFLLILTRVFSLPLTSLPCITGLVWIFFIYASLLLLKDYTWGYYGLLWILISCVLITFGFVAGKKIAKQTHASYHRREPLKPNRVLIKKFLYVSIALGLAYGIIKLRQLGISFSLDLDMLGAANNETAVARYSGTIENSLPVQFLLSFVYLAPLLGGVVYAFSHSKKEKILGLASFAPELFAFSFSNEKATLIICIFLWISAYIVAYLRIHGKHVNVSIGRAFAGLAIGAGVAAVLIISMTLRMGEMNADNLDTALQKFSNSYAFSHIAAFDDYFMHADTGNPTLGAITFYGISNFLGVSTRDQGVYTDSFSSGDIGTNVFTPFRGLLSDFGIIGALFFQFVIAFLAGIWTHRTMHSRANPYISISCLIATYAFVLFTYVSIFSYLSIIVAFIFFTAILAINPLIVKSESAGR